MNDAILYEARNSLTEYSTNYRLINTPLMFSYVSLERKKSQLSTYLFLKVVDSRLYGERAKTKLNEDRRIYTDCTMTIESMSRDLNPQTDYDIRRNVLNAKTNLPRIIKELDDLNIFYYWKYNEYYMFVMERDFGCWKYYNPTGCVIPKTIKKISALSGDMIKCMANMANGKNIDSVNENIRCSYGKFLRRMIGKMNPLVAHSLPVFTSESLGEYLKCLQNSLGEMSAYAGLVIDDKFDKNLPQIVRRRLKKYVENITEKHVMASEDTMIKEIQKEKISLESEIIPKEQNIVKKRRGRRPKSEFKMPDKLPEPSAPKLYRYDEEVDPFKDAKEFMRYYRAFLTMKFNKTIKFDGFESDAPYAAQILDLLIAHKRSDKVFLNGWLSHFCDQNLKGGKAYKTQYTSMKALKDTFLVFIPLFSYVDA